MPKKIPDFMWKEYRAMSTRVGKIIPFLQQTACMNREEREIIAWCKVFKILFPQVEDFNKFLEEKAIPAMIVLGQANWERDVVTDLGLAESKQKRKTENVKETLEE